MIEHIDNMD